MRSLIIGSSPGGTGGSGSVTIGNPVTGGTNNTVLFIDGSGNLGSEVALSYNSATDTLTVTNHGATIWTGSPTAATSIDLGSTTAPFRNLFLYGSGTFSTTSIKLDGAPTGARVATFPDSSTNIPIISQTVTLSGPSAARTYTIRDANDTIVTTGNSNTFSANNTFSSGPTQINTDQQLAIGTGAGQGALLYVSALTPDSNVMWTGPTSNTWHELERADTGFDFNNGLAGTAAATDPAFIIHSHNQNTTEYNHLNFMGSHGGNVTTLTDNVATAFFHTPIVTAGQMYIGTGTYAVKVLDASNETQVAAGTFEWYVMRGNTGGTVAGIQETGAGTPLKATSSGTLTVALSQSVTTNVATFFMTADTSLTATTFTITSQVDVRTGPAEVLAD